MPNSRRASRVVLPPSGVNVIIAGLAGALGLFLLAAGSRADARIAPPDSASSSCSFVAVTVTTDIMRDTWPGAAADRTIYFSNLGDSGSLAVSTQVSDLMPSCYVWASAAFSVSQATQLTPTLTGPIAEFDYPFSSSHGPTVTLLLTASAHITGSTLPPHQIITLTFVRDPKPHKTWLPIVMRDYLAPLINGDFEQGWLEWTHGQGPFNGHGSGLSQTIVLSGTHVAQLGDPSYDGQSGSIPVGYAYLARQLAPGGAHPLSFSYYVHSLDTSFGISTTEYFDTFEVSINTPPDQVTDAQRNGPNGCQASTLNPDHVTRIPTTDGLIVCAGAPAASSGGVLWDSGWRTVKLDLTAFTGQNITLYFSNWNREYEAAYYDDHGFFNTFSCVDNVQFVAGP